MVTHCQLKQHEVTIQSRWLAKRLEWHLLGNHLLANAKAPFMQAYTLMEMRRNIGSTKECIFLKNKLENRFY